MTWHHNLRALAVAVTLCTMVSPVAAEQRGARGPRGGGQGDGRGSPRGAQEGVRGGGQRFGPWVTAPWVTAPDIWPGPGDGPYSPLAASRWGRSFGGPIFRGAQGWWPYRDYGFRTGFAAPYYGFQPGLAVAPGLWSGQVVPFPAWQAAVPGIPGVPMMPGVPGLPVAPPTPGVPGAPAVPVVPGDPSLYMTPHPFYPPPAMWAVPPRVVPEGPPLAGTSAPAEAQAAPGDTPDVGGLSFELTPADAEVWVDGGYAGRADEFGPQRPPLPLEPGPHRLELRAAGHQTVAVDIQIPPGQVLPYRGSLRRVP